MRNRLLDQRYGIGPHVSQQAFLIAEKFGLSVLTVCLLAMPQALPQPGLEILRILG